MRYFLIVMFTLFFIGCYEEDMEPDFCENHICQSECGGNYSKTDVYKDGELFMIECMADCGSRSFLFMDDTDKELGIDSCELFLSDNDGICEINNYKGGTCPEFFSKYE